MDPVYLRKDAIPAVPYGGDWVAGTAYKKGEFVTIDGLLFMCNIAHTSASATRPYADPAVIYARQYRGAYSATTTYAKYDAVSYAGHSFYSLAEGNIGHTPKSDGSDNAYWGCYAHRGIDGAQGEQGIKGDAGTAAENECIEDVSGTMDGSNQTFTLSHTPAGQILLFYNGLFLDEGATDDFSISGTTITLHYVKPNAANGDKLKARYLY